MMEKDLTNCEALFWSNISLKGIIFVYGGVPFNEKL